jgi:hypothetical protein
MAIGVRVSVVMCSVIRTPVSQSRSAANACRCLTALVESRWVLVVSPPPQRCR